VAETLGGVSALVKLELRGSNYRYARLKHISRVGAWQSNPTRLFFAKGGQIKIKDLDWFDIKVFSSPK
jgi:hypothetical protein